MKTFLSSLRVLLVLTVVTGLLYPLAVWGVGRIFWRQAAEGSLVRRDGHVIGSALLAQKTTDPRYFSPRPSAVDYAAVASGASNLAWTSAKLHDTTAAAETDFRATNHLSATAAIPADAITTSGCGLDPHLTPESVRLQAGRVGTARNFSSAQRVALDELVARQIEGGQFGPRLINVLQLNLALDAAFPSP